MSQYTEQAKQFLKDCNATMEIKYVGLENPNWDSKPHCAYDCTITTPRSNMSVHFYDSLHNTEILTMTLKSYFEKQTHRRYEDATHTERGLVNKLNKQLKQMKEGAVPTEYDILACLTKYDVGSMDDFMSEFGYEIKCAADMTNFINTYNAVVKEYNDVRRCFTEEQIEALQEIS